MPLVAKGTTDAQRQALADEFTPIANDLAPAFRDATSPVDFGTGEVREIIAALTKMVRQIDGDP